MYPLGQWLTLEQYSDGYKTTGLTWSRGEKAPTTRLGEAVDVNFLPWIGQGATIDWGKQAYSSTRERRHRRRRLIRHDAQRARPRRGRDRGLAARHSRAWHDAHLPRRPRRERRRRPQPGRLGPGRGPGRTAGTPIDIGPSTRPRRGTGPSTARASMPTATGVSYPFMADYAPFTAGLPLSTVVHHDASRRSAADEDRRDRRAAPTPLGDPPERQLGLHGPVLDPEPPAGDGPGQLDDPANLVPLPQATTSSRSTSRRTRTARTSTRSPARRTSTSSPATRCSSRSRTSSVNAAPVRTTRRHRRHRAGRPDAGRQPAVRRAGRLRPTRATRSRAATPS